jgi:hypothetical protein
MPTDPLKTPTSASDDAVATDLAPEEFDFEPLWKVRLRLAWRGFKRGWGLFSENKVGIIGLVIIGIFFVMAIGHPILMSTLWADKQDVYDPEIGYDAPVSAFLVVEDVVDPDTEIDVMRARLFDATLSATIGDTVYVPLQPAPPSKAHWLVS